MNQPLRLTLKSSWLLLAVLFTNRVQAQQQRLALLPQQANITKETPAQLNSLGIDYYLGEPAAVQPYNKVYEGQVSLKINGAEEKRSFRSLVENSPALLVLRPLSESRVEISLNPANPETKGIRNLSLEIQSPTYIGTDTGTANLLQAQTIFSNWGQALTQKEFWDRAKSLDILQQNKLLNYSHSPALTPASKNLCDTLVKRFDYAVFTGAVLKNLIDKGQVVIDQNGKLTSGSNLEQAFYYTGAITDAMERNLYSLPVNSERYPAINLAFKDRFYPNISRLTDLGDNNPNIADTLINGKRYVLMVAWKSQSFIGYLNKLPNGKYNYTSAPKLFQYALFFTTRYDLQKFNAANGLDQMDEADCRTRLMQGLGLTPNSTNNLFVEFWVGEHDVFRPAIDSSLTSNQLFYNLHPEYIASFATYSWQSYGGSGLLSQYPFTGLGYTYDCSPTSTDHWGMSEFVLKGNKTVYIRRIVPTMEYVKGLKE